MSEATRRSLNQNLHRRGRRGRRGRRKSRKRVVLPAQKASQTRENFNAYRMRFAAYGFDFAAPMPLPTESSTPLMNCTDSGEENLRAISRASLMITARGVPG